MKGSVHNHSSKTLWVLHTDEGSARAHKLPAQRRSPDDCDADAFRAVDGSLVDGHDSWVKVTSISTADVRNEDDGTLSRGCIACYDVEDDEFGEVTYVHDDGWGRPL